MFKTTSDVATYYPFPHYEVTSTGSTTKNIYAGDVLVATIESATPAPQTTYVYTNHLGSTNVTLGEDGYINQVMDYHPYGSLRIDESYGNIDVSRKFTGHQLDRETDLTYMGARYYDGDTGRLTSQDPVSLALGDWKTVQEKTGDKLGFYLQNPQTHNSYSYAFNNPIKYVDQNGEFAWVPVLVVGGILLESFLTDVNVAQAPSANSDLSAAPDSTTIGASFAGDVNNPGIANTVVYGLSIMKPDPMDAKKILKSWNPGTFPNKMQSIRYHLSKHGQGRSMSEYTSDGQKFYNNYANTGVEHKLRNGDVGIKITSKENNYFGIYDSSGKQVTHGAIDKKKEFSVD